MCIYREKELREEVVKSKKEGVFNPLVSIDGIIKCLDIKGKMRIPSSQYYLCRST